MSLLCQGDFEGWVVEGPGPAPGIWVTMETGPRGDNKHGMEFQRSQPGLRGRGTGKFRKVFCCCCFEPRGSGEAQEGSAVFRIKDPGPAPQRSHLEPDSGFSILHHQCADASHSCG